jgi:ketose-bisphosphate aldolase
MTGQNAFADMLQKARMDGYAVAAFNVYNLESFQAAIGASESTGMPVIAALGERYFQNLRPRAASALFHGLQKSGSGAKNPLGQIGLHLDHATEVASCFEAIEAGFTSVMIDASHLPYSENIQRTKQVVDAAHEHGVGVEAELGGLAAGEHSHEFFEGREDLTDPSQALDFVTRTGVDALAVSVGTVHGLYRGEPHIDMSRLAAIARLVAVPLVLHGGSGTPPDLLAGAIRLGIAKVNVNTEISVAAVKALKNAVQSDRMPHLSELALVTRSAMDEVMDRYMRVFRGDGSRDDHE